jgi:hypothetical protein
MHEQSRSIHCPKGISSTKPGQTTVFDLIFPRILAGEKSGKRELADLGQGGLCQRCDECRYPVCPFGK